MIYIGNIVNKNGRQQVNVTPIREYFLADARNGNECHEKSARANNVNKFIKLAEAGLPLFKEEPISKDISPKESFTSTTIANLLKGKHESILDTLDRAGIIYVGQLVELNHQGLLNIFSLGKKGLKTLLTELKSLAKKLTYSNFDASEIKLALTKTK